MVNKILKAKREKSYAVCRFTERLSGTVKISGSKNAALPILAATLLTDEECVIKNVPALDDVFVIFELLKRLGKEIRFAGNTAKIRGKAKHEDLPENLVRKLRASVLVMGPLLARRKKGSFAVPGGCALGERPVDIHLDGLKALGAECKISHGRMVFAKMSLKGADIKLRFPSVGATENLLMAASGISGETVISNAAEEPEVEDLYRFLKAMGADISHKENAYVVSGKKRLGGCGFSVMPDRIEAGTFLLAAAAVGGEVKVKNVIPGHLEAVTAALSASGADIGSFSGGIKITASARPKPAVIETKPYPGFPTDLQPLWAVYMLKAAGVSRIKESIFPGRFMYVDELKRLNAKMFLEKGVLTIRRSRLSGASLLACDLRASAAMIIAGLAAHGKTTVSDLSHLFRGYENFFKKLKLLGANVSIKGALR